MDGKDITELYNTDQYIYELHLDHSAQVLYWATSREIWSMGVDGSNPIVLLQLPNHIGSFAQWNNLVYWTNYNSIHSITKDGSSNTTLVKSLDATCYYPYTRYNAIAIISGNKQQPGNPDLELSPTSTRLHSHVQDRYIYTLPPQAPIPVVMTMVAAVNSVSWVQWIPGDTPVQMKVPEEYVYIYNCHGSD